MTSGSHCVAEPCPPEAAVCLVGGSKPVNLGRVRDGPQWKDGISVLKYTDGDLCPDQIRKKSTTIRFTCNENQVVSDSFLSPAAAAALGTVGLKGHQRLTSLGTGVGELRMTLLGSWWQCGIPSACGSLAPEMPDLALLTSEFTGSL